MATTFQIITMDRLDVIYTAIWRCKGPMYAGFFTATCVLFGSYILMNLFLAYFLRNLEFEQGVYQQRHDQV